MRTEFWDIIYIDKNYDKDDHFGRWHEDPKYVNEPPHVFVRKDLAKPEPSTNFSIPRDNPGTEYLLYEDGHGWFVGWWDSRRKGFYWTSHNLKGDEILSPTHWLPLPDAP